MHLTVWTATGCSFCEPMKRIAEEMARNSGWEYNSVNLDQNNRDLFREWGVTGVPTITLVENREEVARVTGSMTRRALETEIERHLQRDVFSEQSGEESTSSSSVLRNSGEQENPEQGVHQDRDCAG